MPVADGVAQPGALLLGHPGSQGRRRHPPRLCDADLQTTQNIWFISTHAAPEVYRANCHLEYRVVHRVEYYLLLMSLKPYFQFDVNKIQYVVHNLKNHPVYFHSLELTIVPGSLHQPASYRYCGIWVDLPHPVSPTMTTT